MRRNCPVCGNPRGREEARDPAAIGTILSPPREARRREPRSEMAKQKDGRCFMASPNC